MPRRLINKIKTLINGKKKAPPGPRIIPAGEHSFDPRDVSHGAHQVLDRLVDAGYEAYLVGGSIRDGLLGAHPKDFDVATSAHPEQIQQVFRSARLIGRRFRLAHVRMGREIIEVATFRGHYAQPEVPDDEDNGNVSEQGLILNDNVFGTVQEDAIRRDFTTNALFFRHTDGAIIDYVGGFDDVLARRLRLIGDPETRFREDPVRMLRAARFAAKLDFTIEPATAQVMRPLAPLLRHVPAARLFEEFLKLFLSGHAVATWKHLQAHGLAEALFPATAGNSPEQARMIDVAMKNTDDRLAQDKPVTPAYLFAVLLWGPLMREWEKLKSRNVPPVPAFQQAAQNVVQRQNEQISIPKRFQIPMREIWDMQMRLPRRQGKRAAQLFEHPRFRASYDFLLLRETAGETEAGLGAWWTRYQQLPPEDREAMANRPEARHHGQPQGGNAGRTDNRASTKTGLAADADTDTDTDTDSGDEHDASTVERQGPPRRRRPRRRRRGPRPEGSGQAQ